MRNLVIVRLGYSVLEEILRQMAGIVLSVFGTLADTALGIDADIVQSRIG